VTINPSTYVVTVAGHVGASNLQDCVVWVESDLGSPLIVRNAESSPYVNVTNQTSVSVQFVLPDGWNLDGANVRLVCSPVRDRLLVYRGAQYAVSGEDFNRGGYTRFQEAIPANTPTIADFVAEPIDAVEWKVTLTNGTQTKTARILATHVGTTPYYTIGEIVGTSPVLITVTWAGGLQLNVDSPEPGWSISGTRTEI
jgi:hypothetical protein